MRMAGSLYDIYQRLRQHFGALYGAQAVRAWWPIFGDDPCFEMVLGAVLVQQTRWEAVETTVLRLRDAGQLAPAALAHAHHEHLVELLRGVAFYTQKAHGIIRISDYLCTHYQGDAARLLARATATVRPELLALPRIGPESADVIMLYAGNHPVFVVDEYTRRMLQRVQPCWERSGGAAVADWHRARYTVVRQHIEQELAHPPALPVATMEQFYGDYHALINELCVRYCLARRPRCDGPPSRRVYSSQAGRNSYLEHTEGCPLRGICAFYAAERSTASGG